MSPASPNTPAAASAAVAWVVLANKPLYPLYVAWLVGEGASAATITLATAPVYLLIALEARERPLLRWLLPVVGAADAVLATKIFGAGAGLEAFLAPCAALATFSADGGERPLARGLLSFLFLIFVALRAWRPEPFVLLSAPATERLQNLDILSAAGLVFFIGWRFSGLRAP